MNTSLSGTWQSSERQGAASAANNQKTQYLTAFLSINRQLSSFMTGSLQFVHTQTDSNNLTTTNNILGGVGSYDANRITANLNVIF
jgi:hypothetical protein